MIFYYFSVSNIRMGQENQHGTGIYWVDKYQQYLSEFVYGGMDGSVTTFAVVAGAYGASLESSVIIILGFANLMADGFSMSIGAYLSSKSTLDNYQKHRKIEYWEIENKRESEIEEIRDIYRQKGFEGDLLEQVVSVITADKDRWVDTMMKEELEMIPDGKTPFMVGIMTMISFLLVGFIPLFIFVWDYLYPIDVHLFTVSAALTGTAFLLIGWASAYVNQTSVRRGIWESLLLGVIAAMAAYWVGYFLDHIIT